MGSVGVQPPHTSSPWQHVESTPPVAARSLLLVAKLLPGRRYPATTTNTILPPRLPWGSGGGRAWVGGGSNLWRGGHDIEENLSLCIQCFTLNSVNLKGENVKDR